VCLGTDPKGNDMYVYLAFLGQGGNHARQVVGLPILALVGRGEIRGDGEDLGH
jgi:hypothetical protein